tara:strand:+ start:643 stop:1311 length:669 start_codon:yes stop_codon:yes gene_type:complete
MARNPHFRENVSGEQKLIEDLSIEIIKTMGKDMIYIPRTLVNKDDLFGEDDSSKFSNGYPVEMYIQSIDGFEGEGDILGKFGIEIKDRVTLIIARKRFNEAVGSYANLERPKEGDLIYFPLSDGLFEINFVEHENPFYQLGKLFSYRLDCELFTYSHEDFETGNSEIDDTESDRQRQVDDYIVPLDPSTGATAGDNDSYEDFKNIDNIFDFTDKDPFSEGNY